MNTEVISSSAIIVVMRGKKYSHPSQSELDISAHRSDSLVPPEDK